MACLAARPSLAVLLAGEANTELLRESSGNSFDDLVSAPRMVLEQYIRTQVGSTARRLDG
jgi:hypothetical protein